MRKRKKLKKILPADNLIKLIGKASANLYYISETDAEILPFAGAQTDSVTKEALIAQIGKDVDIPVEERDFKEFFNNLTEMQDWFGDEEKQTARKFSKLRDLLQKNLKDLKVFKIGKIELDVYVVGLDAKGILTGIKTKAVET